jgi:hypothetical protein
VVPLPSVFVSVLFVLKLPVAGAGVTVELCVDVDVSEDIWAWATPAIIANAAALARKYLLICVLLERLYEQNRPHFLETAT